jgi:hypothetical protein
MTETFIVGDREFTVMRMNAFTANSLMLRIQKIAMPIMGTLAGGKGLGDMDVKEAAMVISQHLDESVMASIILPMFEGSQLYSVENKRKIKSEADINMCFTIENLFDMYELIFEVARFQFGPFFGQLMGRFGSLSAPEKVAKSPEN